MAVLKMIIVVSFLLHFAVLASRFIMMDGIQKMPLARLLSMLRQESLLGVELVLNQGFMMGVTRVLNQASPDCGSCADRHARPSLSPWGYSQTCVP